MPALSMISGQESKPMEDMKKVKQFLNYCASEEDANNTYKMSNKVLALHNDAWYLDKKDTRSLAGGILSLQKYAVSHNQLGNSQYNKHH